MKVWQHLDVGWAFQIHTVIQAISQCPHESSPFKAPHNWTHAVVTQSCFKSLMYTWLCHKSLPSSTSSSSSSGMSAACN